MDPNVYMPLTAAATFCALLALGFGMKRGRGQRTAAHGGEPVLGGATDDDGEPPGGPPPAPSPLMLTYAFVVSLIVIIPSVYVIFFAGPTQPGRDFATGLVGGIVGFWTGKAPEFFSKQ